MKNKIIIVIFYLSVLFSNVLANKKTQNSPNIVFILADDLGWADLPVYGNSFNEAPTITEMANDGMRFENAYAASPVCSPTRASIMSGQYPARLGINDFIPGHWRPYEEVIVPRNRTQFLPEDIITIGEALMQAGYKTGYFGKWHLGNKKEHLPSNQGFEESIVGQRHYNPTFSPEIKYDPSKRLSELLADFGESFIERNKDNPFFLFLSYYDVHVQLAADHDIIQKYLKKERKDSYPGNAVYAAMIEHLDRSIERIFAKLKKENLEENTIVIFFSDNGGLIHRNDNIPLIANNNMSIYDESPLKYIASSNSPLRDEKGTVYEGGIRVPLIVKWPGKIKKGSTSEAIVSSIDFYPTLLDVACAEKPQDYVLDGRSILPELLDNESDSDRAVFWHYPVYHHGVPSGAVRKGDWKLIKNFVTGEIKLYNLKADISETFDLSNLYPDIAESLHALLLNWQNEMKADFPQPNPDFNQMKRLEWGVYRK